MQDMYEDRVTEMRCAVRMTDGFKVVGLHQGSTLSSFLICNGDGQFDGRDQIGVSVDYDVCG